MPQVSVLLSIRNGAEELARTIGCLRRQTVEDIEILVMDDGSTDDTPALLAGIAAKDSRLRLFRHEESRGLTRSLNELLAAATAPLVAREDCGDFSLANRFELQLSHLAAHPNHVAVAGDFWIMSEEGEVIGVRRVPADPGRLREQLATSNPICHGTLMIRAEVLRRIGGYDESMRLAQDYDLLLRLLQEGDIGSVPQPLAAYVYAPGGLTFRNLRSQMAHMELSRHRHLGGEKPEILEHEPLDFAEAAARYHLMMGRMLLAKARTAEARRHFDIARCHPALAETVHPMRIVSFFPAWLLRLIKGVRKTIDDEPRPGEPATLDIPPNEE